ncbi:MAG: RagB/SusD family nutrient uptake outer membrane protein [Paludibacteraceae bacterium]
MKNILSKIFVLLITGSIFVGCDKMLDVDSERVVLANEYDMTAPNDSLYSMFGVFTQLQKVADSYVLLGELRGDLMDVQDQSDMYLKEINSYNISSENPYANIKKDYYSIINNCNYIIKKIALSSLPDLDRIDAACRAIRAWSYMQIVLNYGSAIYYEEPILSVAQANEVQKLQPVKFNELADILINDLLPIKDVQSPYLTSQIYTQNFAYSFFPVRFILGDLYLWSGQYQKAAQEYRDLIYNNSYTIQNNRYENNREVVNNAFSGNILLLNGGWHSLFASGSNEYIANIASTNEYGYKFKMDSLTINAKIVASDAALNNWAKQMYYHSATLDTLGDLRRIGSVTNRMPTSSSSTTNENYLIAFNPAGKKYIAKYVLMNPITNTINTNKKVIVYRVALLYLRYAEAVNRAGKPNMAFAVLKNGLNKSNMKLIPNNEVDSVNVPSYLDFRDQRFNNNIGTRMRGLGNVNLDTVHYIIPKLPSLQDSVLFVEDKIQEELALETAFEGNRFHDLMRFALRRNDNSYLADKVVLKYKTNQEAIRAKLMDSNNWYLKK